MAEEQTRKIIEACVPAGTAEKLARLMSISADLVNRWKRRRRHGEPLDHERGQNPLDRVEALQDHAFAHAHLICEYFCRRHRQHFSQYGLIPHFEERAFGVCMETLECVLVQAPPDRVRAVWEQVKAEAEDLVRKLEKGNEKQ